ncbi:uncharacterized protein [Lepeophtheirus salmonis]|uniref:uncharacterized protein isoform X2 n=1 Tax=Lepeophtheirus salmonis TaxID=72036 RepID=UPI001AE213CE|nr:uncharacterized protein LOC121128545 isoform X3 [Lepeophtheirus salmonis]
MKFPSFFEKYNYTVTGISIFVLMWICISTRYLVQRKAIDFSTIILVDSNMGTVQDFRKSNLSRNKRDDFHPRNLEKRIKSNLVKDELSLKPSPLILIILSVIIQIIAYYIYSLIVFQYNRYHRNVRMNKLLKG